MILNLHLTSATIACIIFIASLALSKKGNTPLGYRCLSFLFLSLAFVFANDLIDGYGLFGNYPSLAIVFQPSIYAVAPFIYLSVFYLTTPEKQVSLKVIAHFIPFFLVLGLYTMAYVSQTNSQISNATETSDDKVVELFLLFMFFVQLFVYLFFSMKKLRHHQLTLPLFVSNLSDNDYHWLFKTIVGLSVLSLLSFAEVVVDQMDIPFYFSFFYLLGFYYIGIQIANQKEVFPFTSDQMNSVADLISEQQVPEEEIKAVYEKTKHETERENKLSEPRRVIPEDNLEMYKKNLLSIMEKEKPYLDSEITLPKLAGLLLLNSYQASYLVNTCFDENFYGFINGYRLEECKRMLISDEYDHLSILGIAFECGFNSKTTFNTAFKKNTGLTPKEFKMKALANRQIGSGLSTP